MIRSSLETQNIKIYLQDIYAKKLRNIEIFMENLKFIGENRCKNKF